MRAVYNFFSSIRCKFIPCRFFVHLPYVLERTSTRANISLEVIWELFVANFFESVSQKLCNEGWVMIEWKIWSCIYNIIIIIRNKGRKNSMERNNRIKFLKIVYISFAYIFSSMLDFLKHWGEKRWTTRSNVSKIRHLAKQHRPIGKSSPLVFASWLWTRDFPRRRRLSWTEHRLRWHGGAVGGASASGCSRGRRAVA